MRVLVISDTHKKHENLKVVLERVSPVDLVIHLGDAEGYEDYIWGALWLSIRNCGWK